MSRILEVGSSILLPPVHGRLELIHSILPEDPLLFADLTIGQVSKNKFSIMYEVARQDLMSRYFFSYSVNSWISYCKDSPSELTSLESLQRKYINFITFPMME